MSIFKKCYMAICIPMLLASTQVYAEYVWLKPVGCATVVDFKKTNEEPQFYFGSKKMTMMALEMSSKPYTQKAGGGGDTISSIASAIPGVGLLASAAIGTVSESIVNGAINSSRGNSVQAPMLDPNNIAYKLTVKPDYGDQFTVIYGLVPIAVGEKSNPMKVDISTLAIGSRIQIMKTESDGIVNLSFGIRFAGLFTANYFVPKDPEFTNENKKDYLRNCYGDNPDQYEAILYREGQLISNSLPASLKGD